MLSSLTWSLHSVLLAWCSSVSDFEVTKIYRILAYRNDRHTWLYCLSIHRSFSCAPFVGSRLSSIHRWQGETTDRGRPLQVGRWQADKPRNLTYGSSWATTGREHLRICCHVLEVCDGGLHSVQAHKASRGSQQLHAITACHRAVSHTGGQGECVFHGQGGGKELSVAWVQL